MKKLTALLLAIILTLTLAACGGDAPENDPNPSDTSGNITTTTTPATAELSEVTDEPTQQEMSISGSAKGVELSLDNSVYMPTQRMEVTITGVSDEMISAMAFISIYPVGGSHEDYGEYHYPQKNTEILIFEAPLDVGDYEMRFYEEDENYTDETLLIVIPFKVSNDPLGTANDSITNDDSATAATSNNPTYSGVTMSLNKSEYYPNETITVTVKRFTQEMIDDKAYVTLHEIGWGGSDNIIKKEYMQSTGTITLKAPSEEGVYQVWLYGRDNDTSSIITGVDFTVVPKPPEPEATTTAQSAEPQTFTITITNNSGYDWRMNRLEINGAGRAGLVGQVEFDEAPEEIVANGTSKTFTLSAGGGQGKFIGQILRPDGFVQQVNYSGTGSVTSGSTIILESVTLPDRSEQISGTFTVLPPN